MRLLRLLVCALLLIGFSAAWAGQLEFKAELSGAEEVPMPVVTDTTGEAKLEVDAGRTRIDYELEIEDGENVLGAAGAHIHCGPAGMNGPVAAFLTGMLPGGVNGELQIKATLSQANVMPTACGSTLSELVDAMLDGQTYVNVHSSDFPGGVVRGQIFLDGSDDEGDDDEGSDDEGNDDHRIRMAPGVDRNDVDPGLREISEG